MPIKKFNAVAGISVGDDVIFEVIDDTANVTANNLSVTATTDLGSLSNVKITGGQSGYVIRTDGQGNLSWENPADVGVVGNDTEIQFNDNGLFGAVPEFTFSKSSNTLNVTGNISSGNVSGGNLVTANYFTGTLTTHSQPNITSVGTLSSLVVGTDITPNVDITYDLGNATHRFKDLWLSGQTIQMDNATIEVLNDTIVLTNPAGGKFIVDGSSTRYSSVAVTVSANAQPNITSVGTLVNLSVSGSISGTSYDNANFLVPNDSDPAWALGMFANATDFFMQTKFWGGDDVHHGFRILDVNNNTIPFKVDGTGITTVANLVSTGNVSALNVKTDNLLYANGQPWDLQQPAGSNTQIVFNDSNNFGASSQFTFDKSSNTLTVGDNTYNTTISYGNVDTTGDISGNNLSITSQIFADTIDVTGNITATVGTLTANKGVFYDDTELTGGNFSVTGGGHIELNGSTIDLSSNQAGVFNTGITDINIGLGANVTLSASGLLTTVRGNLKADNLDVTGNITAGNINLSNVVVTNTNSGNVTVNNLKVTNLLSNRNLINVSNDTTLDSFPINRYRTAKYTIRIGSDDGFQAIEVLLVHDDLTAHVTVYGSLSTSGTDLVYLTADIVSSVVYLKATATSTNTTANMIASYVTD